MKLWLTVLLLAAAAAMAQKVEPKPAEIEVTEATALRQQGRVMIDMRLRNLGEKPVRQLNLFFDFLNPAKNVVATKRGTIEQEMLAPGDDAEFHGQVEDSSRAVAIRVRFEDAEEREIRSTKVVTLLIE